MFARAAAICPGSTSARPDMLSISCGMINSSTARMMMISVTTDMPMASDDASASRFPLNQPENTRSSLRHRGVTM